MRAYLEWLGNGAWDASGSVVLTLEHKRVLFQCGEGTQRLLHEYRVRTGRIRDVLLLHLDAEACGGMLGLLLTLSDAEHGGVRVIGPRGLQRLFRAADGFARRPDYAVTVTEVGGEGGSPVLLIDDPVMRVYGVLLQRNGGWETGEERSKRPRRGAAPATTPTVRTVGIWGNNVSEEVVNGPTASTSDAAADAAPPLARRACRPPVQPPATGRDHHGDVARGRLRADRAAGGRDGAVHARSDHCVAELRVAGMAGAAAERRDARRPATRRVGQRRRTTAAIACSVRTAYTVCGGVAGPPIQRVGARHLRRSGVPRGDAGATASLATGVVSAAAAGCSKCRGKRGGRDVAIQLAGGGADAALQPRTAGHHRLGSAATRRRDTVAAGRATAVAPIVRGDRLALPSAVSGHWQRGARQISQCERHPGGLGGQRAVAGRRRRHIRPVDAGARGTRSAASAATQIALCVDLAHARRPPPRPAAVVVAARPSGSPVTAAPAAVAAGGGTTRPPALAALPVAVRAVAVSFHRQPRAAPFGRRAHCRLFAEHPGRASAHAPGRALSRRVRGDDRVVHGNRRRHRCAPLAAGVFWRHAAAQPRHYIRRQRCLAAHPRGHFRRRQSGRGAGAPPLHHRAGDRDDTAGGAATRHPDALFAAIRQGARRGRCAPWWRKPEGGGDAAGSAGHSEEEVAAFLRELVVEFATELATQAEEEEEGEHRGEDVQSAHGDDTGDAGGRLVLRNPVHGTRGDKPLGLAIRGADEPNKGVREGSPPGASNCTVRGSIAAP
eukprot:ctg_1381.g423